MWPLRNGAFRWNSREEFGGGSWGPNAVEGIVHCFSKGVFFSFIQDIVQRIICTNRIHQNTIQLSPKCGHSESETILSHIFQYSPSTIVNFVVTDICISFCFPFKFSNFDLFNIEVFHFIHPLHILVVSDKPRYRPFRNHCFKSSLTIYSPLVIFCTRNYHINCSFLSSHKN